MRKLLGYVASAAAILATSSALAAPTLDGTVGGGEYGAATAVVGTDPAAPTSNFGSSTNVATAGYEIYLTDVDDTLFGAIKQTGGVSDGVFTNLYFDVDPVTGVSGSDLGFEVTNQRAFIPGLPGYYDFPSAISYTSTTVGGLATIEFSIANSIFRDFIALADLSGYFGPGGYTEQNVRLNLSQSLGYSVAGGQASYGDARLGTFSVAQTAAVPEPATWAMMLLGFGAVGFAMRHRRQPTVRVKLA